jgi:GNAT superfamily N-acetyltransferase
VRTEIHPFEPGLLDDAAALLAERHRAHRSTAPGLDPAFEDPAGARCEIDQLAAAEDASGVVAIRGGALAGYLLGTRRDDATWGPNTWIEAAGHAAADGDTVRELYAVAAARWMDEERTHQYVVVPSSDRALVDAWFSLGFGQQHVHALREAPPASFRPVTPAGLVIRRATRADIPALAVLDLVLPAHQARSPVFSHLPAQALEDARAEIEADFDDPRFTTFVAAHDGRVIGSAIACSLEMSTSNSGLIRPASAGFLGFAAVLPEARGLGSGRALGEAVLAWSRDEGYPWVATDWRATNLEAAGTWPRLGFRPTFLRLHRAIV